MGGSEFVQGEAAASDAPTVDIEDLIEPSVADTAPAARRSFAAACAQAFSPTRIVTAGGMAMALLTGVFWVDNESEKAAEAVRVAAAVKPVWTEISRPIPLYALAAPELEKRAKTYEARRHATGGGRKDALTFGAADGPDPLIALEVYRIGSEAAPPRSFFVDLARVAGADSLGVERSGQPAPLTTRFGAFEAADLTLSGAAGDLQCLGFRLAPEDIALRVSGFACGAPACPSTAFPSPVCSTGSIFSRPATTASCAPFLWKPSGDWAQAAARAISPAWAPKSAGLSRARPPRPCAARRRQARCPKKPVARGSIKRHDLAKAALAGDMFV